MISLLAKGVSIEREKRPFVARKGRREKKKDVFEHCLHTLARRRVRGHGPTAVVRLGHADWTTATDPVPGL